MPKRNKKSSDGPSTPTVNPSSSNSAGTELSPQASQPRSSSQSPNERTLLGLWSRAPEEPLARACRLAGEAARLFTTKQYSLCFILLQDKLTPELLKQLPASVQLQVRLHFNFSYYFTFPRNGNLLFDTKISRLPDNDWLRVWQINNLLDPETLTTVTEAFLAFAIDLLPFYEQKKALEEAPSFVEHYFIHDLTQIIGFTRERVQRWFTTVEASATKRRVEASFRVALFGPDSADTHSLLDLIDPSLVIKLFTFAFIRLVESPFERTGMTDRTKQFYGCLLSYCDYYNYPFHQTLSLLEYRLFNGSVHYHIWWEVMLQKNLFREHIKQTDLPDEFTQAALQAFEEIRTGDYEETNHLFDICDRILAVKKLTLDRFEERLLRAEETALSDHSTQISRLLEAKRNYLHIYRDLLLNRFLFALGLLNHPDCEVNIDGTLAIFAQVLAVSPSAGPYSVTLEPLGRSLCLHIACTALSVGRIAQALTILETLPADAAVCHRLGDCHLRLFLDRIRENERIAAETKNPKVADLREKPLDETASCLLEGALDYYAQAREQVRYLMESRPWEGEERKATLQYREYQRMAYASESGAQQSEARSSTGNKKLAKSRKRVKEMVPESILLTEDKRAIIDENYSGMHETFLEEMYIQTTLNIVYCLLWQHCYEEVLEETRPLLANRGISLCSPYAVSQFAYFLASLYTAEAHFELGNGQLAAVHFDSEEVARKYVQSRSEAEDPHQVWREHLCRESELPYCSDKLTVPKEPATDNRSILEDIFSYNYLTTFASMGRPERLPGRLARLRPNSFASKGTLSLYSAFSKLIEPRLGELRDSLQEGFLKPEGNFQEENMWKATASVLKQVGGTLPDWLLSLFTAKGRPPLTSEHHDLLLLAFNCGQDVVSVTIPGDSSNPSVPKEITLSRFSLSDREYAAMTPDEKCQTVLNIAQLAYSDFTRHQYTECFRHLEESMTPERLRLLSSRHQTDLVMCRNLSYFYTERIETLLLGTLANSVWGYWNIEDLLAPETLSIVASHLINFAVHLIRDNEQSSQADACLLLERFLWTEQKRIKLWKSHEAEYEWIRLQGETRKVEATFRRSVCDPKWGPRHCPLLEALDPTLACKILYFLICTLREKMGKPEFAIRLYGNLRSYLNFANYQAPTGLALLQYRLFTGTARYSIEWEIDVQKDVFLKTLSQYSELTDEAIAAAERAFTLYQSKKDYAGADRQLVECDRQLGARKKDQAKFEKLVEKERDEGLKSSLAERLIEAKAKYLTVYRDIRLLRAMLALDRSQTEGSDSKRAFELLQEALTVASGPGPYSATLEPINDSLLFHFADSAASYGNLQAVIQILETLLPANNSLLVYHRLGDCLLRQYLDLIEDNGRIAAEIAHCKGESNELFTKLPQTTLEAASNKLEQAYRYYRKAQQLVGSLIENHTLESEDSKAATLFADYKISCLSPKANLSLSEQPKKKPKDEASTSKTGKTKKGKGKNAKKGKGAGSKAKKTQIPQERDSDDEADPQQKKSEIDFHLRQQDPKEYYFAMQHTFLEEMYVQLSLNLSYCALLQRRYASVLTEIGQFLLSAPFPGKLYLSPNALSRENYMLMRLYLGVASFEVGDEGNFNFASLDYDSALEGFSQQRQSSSEDENAFWRSYLQENTEYELLGLPNCTDRTLTGRGILEGIFSFNLLTVLANFGAKRRLPVGFALPRPNPIASKGTLGLFTDYQKIVDYRWRQVRQGLAEGRFNCLKEIEMNEIDRTFPKCIAERLTKTVHGYPELTLEESGLLLRAISVLHSSGNFPKDEEDPPVPENGEIKGKEVNEASVAIEKAKKIDLEVCEETEKSIELEMTEETEENEQAKGETSVVEEIQLNTENSAPKDTKVEVSQAEEAIQSEAQPTVELDAHSSFEFVENEEPIENEQIEKQIIEEDAVQPAEMLESKWSHMDEQLELGADDEDVNSEGSSIWDSVPQDVSNLEPDVNEHSAWAHVDEQLEMGADNEDRDCVNQDGLEEDEEEVEVEWDNPQDTLENDTFFGLPSTPLPPELLSPQADTKPDTKRDVLRVETRVPAVKVSSTAKSQKAQAAANEIGNLLSKCTLASTEKRLSPTKESLIWNKETQFEKAPLQTPHPPTPTFAPAAPAAFKAPVLGLVDLKANNRSLAEYLGTCPATKATNEATQNPISHPSLHPSNFMYGIGQFSPLPPANQCILDRYLNEQQQISDCASSKRPTPPPGGSPFGPIGPPPKPLQNQYLDTFEEDSHDLELIQHHVEELQKLLSKKKAKRASTPVSQSSFPRFPEWTKPAPALGQGLFGSVPANPNDSFFSRLPSWSGIGSKPEPLLPKTPSTAFQTLNSPSTFGNSVSTESNFPKGSALFDPFRPSTSNLEKNLGASSPDQMNSSSQFPAPAPNSARQPADLQKIPAPNGQPKTTQNTTLAELFDSFQTKK